MPFVTHEEHANHGGLIKNIILGGQDGLINVLGLILGVATATQDVRLVIISGLAGAFAEAIAMAGSAFSSARAEKDYYDGQVEREKKEMKEIPDVEREEVRLIYYKKGFRGKDLDKIVDKITSDEKLWLETMMREELGLTESGSINPLYESLVVGGSSLIASFIPVIPFALLPVSTAIPVAFLISALILFLAGAYKARVTVGDWKKSGLEMLLVGSLAALAGYLIGQILGARIL